MTVSEQEKPELERHETSGIETYQRKINLWLKVVYVLVAVWAVWYLIANWGGLGPGLAQ